MEGKARSRWFKAVVAVATLVTALGAASATTHTEDHTITICHVTNSATNPWVVITVDKSAFDGDGANDHTHHVATDGRVDVPYVAGDCDWDGVPPGGGSG